MQPEAHRPTRLVGIDVDVVVARRLCREESDHGPRLEPFLVHQRLQHATGVRVQAARCVADDGIAQNVGEWAGKVPRIEKWHPIDVRHQFVERIGAEGTHSQALRHRRRVVGPIDLESLRPRLTEGQLRSLGALVAMLLALDFVIGLDVGDIGVARILGHELLTHTHRPRCVLHVDHGTFVLRIDFHRRMGRRGRRPADQQRLLVP
jgi:hypothetical protein